MRNLIIASALLGATGVGFGAFGAHALRAVLLERGSAGNWETAVHYQLIHAVALLGLAAWGERIPLSMRSRNWVTRVGWCWVAGVILFSGSLYFLALWGARFVWPFTPLGGVFLILGWLFLAVAAWPDRTAE